jgi:hypothetical protein
MALHGFDRPLRGDEFSRSDVAEGSPAGLPHLKFGAEKLPAREANSEHGVRVHFVRPEAE